VILLAAAVAAVVGAVLGSLDSCNEELRNVTVTVPVTRNVTTTVEIVNHLDAIVLIDGSGSMCYDDDARGTNAGSGCTNGTCVDLLDDGSPNINCRTWASGCRCDEDRWRQAKTGIEYLNTQLNTSMNENVTSDTNKIQTGLITWSWISTLYQDQYLMINAPLQSGVTATNNAAESINLPTGGTYWGTGLCQCYKQLQTNGYDGANKLCFLMADGALSGEALGAGTCASSDVGTRGANGACPCDYLWNDVATLGWTSSQGYPDTDSTFVEEFMKDQNITISSILVGSNVDGERIFQAASCDGISWNSGAGAPSTPCDNYLKLTSFDDLIASAEDIAERQRSLASVTQTVTQEETTNIQELVAGKVSVCSLGFLYALLAFIPFFAYILYRIVIIKAMSKSVRKQLYEMIREGSLTRDDMRHFASVATNLLLPENFVSDIDWILSWILFQCPCLLPASKADLEAVFAATTIAL